MNNALYILYAIVLGVVSIVTDEIVTFIMLGFILMSLNNLHKILVKIYLQNERHNEVKE